MNIVWNTCIGQTRAKEILSAALVNDTVSHAYLLSGPEGCGKFALAIDFARALLCPKTDARPCTTCSSCKKVLHFAHPDFRILMPVVVKEKDDDVSEDGWANIGEQIRERMAHPYATPAFEKKPNIPVAAVRDVFQAIRRGTIEAEATVAIIDGIDTLNKAAANSMLKLLEEPPAGTVLLLLTDRITGVLPTIVSRSQVLRLSYLSPDEVRHGICALRGAAPSDPRLQSVADTGSLGASLDLWDNPAGEADEAAISFWEHCAAGDWPATVALIDSLAAWKDVALYERFFTGMMQRVRNAYFSELTGTEKVFSPERDAAGFVQIERLVFLCEQALAAVKAHGSELLVLANFALNLTEMLHGKKQQAG